MENATGVGPSAVGGESSSAPGDAPGSNTGSSGTHGSRGRRMLSAASERGVPLRTILAIDLVVVLTWVTFRVLAHLQQVILWVVIAGFVALVLNPAVAAQMRRRLSRTWAASIVFLGAVLVFVGLLVLFGYPLVNSASRVATRLPTMVDQVQKGHGWLAHQLERWHLLSWVQRNAPKLRTAASNLSRPALKVGTNLGKAVFSTILSFVTIAFLAFFMMLEAPVIRTSLTNLVRPSHRATVEGLAARVSHSVTVFVLGTGALSLLFGLVVFVTMLILGVPFAFLIGLWVALVAMIPLVGGLIAGVPAVLLAVLHSPLAGIITIVVFVAFQLVENHFLYPIVMSRTVRMNPLWVLLAVLIGANLGGAFGSSLGALTGAVIAIPVGGAIQVIVREIWRLTQDGTEIRDGAETLHEGTSSVGPVL